jgi:large subunit ribosomal protein L4
MVEVTKYDKTGKEIGQVELNSAIFDIEINHEVASEYLLLQLANRRRANPRTLTRSQVRGGGRKPWKQKGTGRARAGTRSSPLWVGGGVAHGPDGKNHKKSMPRKVRRLALRSILTERARKGGVVVIEDLNPELPRTRDLVSVVNNLGGEKVLFIQSERTENLELSTRNIPRVKTLLYSNLNPHDLLNYTRVVFLESALSAIEEVVL